MLPQDYNGKISKQTRARESCNHPLFNPPVPWWVVQAQEVSVFPKRTVFSLCCRTDVHSHTEHLAYTKGHERALSVLVQCRKLVLFICLYFHFISPACPKGKTGEEVGCWKSNSWLGSWGVGGGGDLHINCTVWSFLKAWFRTLALRENMAERRSEFNSHVQGWLEEDTRTFLKLKV